MGCAGRLEEYLTLYWKEWMENCIGCTGSLEEYQVVLEECHCTLEDWMYIMGCTGSLKECLGTMENQNSIGCTERFEVYHEVHGNAGRVLLGTLESLEGILERLEGCQSEFSFTKCRKETQMILSRLFIDVVVFENSQTGNDCGKVRKSSEHYWNSDPGRVMPEKSSQNFENYCKCVLQGSEYHWKSDNRVFWKLLEQNTKI